MRIIAGNSQINILSNDQNNSDFIVLAQLLNSSMGYEKPILVRNSRELLIWFGDQFENYEYLKELLDQDRISLYLFRSVETGENMEDIDEDNYYFIPDISPNTWKTLIALDNTNNEQEGVINSTFEDHLLPGWRSLEAFNSGDDSVIDIIDNLDTEKLYKVIRSDGSNFSDGIRYSLYKYNSATKSYVLYDSIGEYKENVSLNNRDRLSVGYYRYEGSDSDIITYSYYYPEFDYITEKTSNTGTIEIEDFDKFQKDILEGRATKHLIASGEDLTIEDLKNDPYIPLREEDGRYTYELPDFKVEVENNGQIEEHIDKLTYFFEIPNFKNSTAVPENTKNGVVFLPDDVRKDYLVVRNSASGSVVYGLATENFLGEYFRNVPTEKLTLQDFCFFNHPFGLLPGRPEFCSYNSFYNVPKKFKVETDFNADQEEVYKYYVEGGEIYRFESKTIGKGSEDIKVEVKWIETYTEKNNIYSIVISRYDYQEFFEGPLEDEFGIERLDHKISRESKLVRFKIIPQTKPEQGWPEGTWELKGAQKEGSKNLEYSFNLMCKTLEDFPPDFILVPKKSDAPDDTRILDWTKNLNCQALITNTVEDLEGNIEDKENRLIYFYNPININDTNVPGYYIFLKGLIYFDSYLPSVIKLSYVSPEERYEEDEENREEKLDEFYELLEQKKSNYLNNNNHYYYYDNYFSGDNYITTPLVRFVVSKITRELEKNKWKIIGEKANKMSEDSMYPILQTIQEKFSIIRSIEINNFIVDGISRTVEASITTVLSDIISSDVSFDITLNYSKLNN